MAQQIKKIKDCVLGATVIYIGIRQNYRDKRGVITEIDYDKGIVNVCFDGIKAEIPCIIESLEFQSD